MEPRLDLIAIVPPLNAGLRLRFANLLPLQRRPYRERDGPRRVDRQAAATGTGWDFPSAPGK